MVNIVPVLIIGALVWWLFRRRKRKDNLNACTSIYSESFTDPSIRNRAEQSMCAQGIIGGSALHRAQGHEVAYQRIMGGVIADTQTKQALYKAIDENGKIDTYEKFLPAGSWSWPEFEKWKRDFLEDKNFPYMWKKYPEICFENFDSIGVTGIAEKMLVKDLKELLTRLQISIPENSKKNNLIDIVSKNISLKMIMDNYPEIYNDLEKVFRQRSNKGMCVILQHTIFSLGCSLRDFYTNGNLKLLPMSGCPVEKKFMKGKGKISELNIPPFFPGDRTGVTFYRRSR